MDDFKAPEGEFRNCIVTEVGEWEMEGNTYPYVGIFNGAQNVRLTIDKASGCVPPADLAFGDRVNIWARLDQTSKVAGDRAFGVLKLKLVNIERAAKVSAKPLTAAA